MKGLLIKDFKLMKNMKNSMLMILVIALGMAYYMKDLSFIIVYLALLGTTFTSSTLSYDEFDKGYSFLFTLPVTRKEYVIEKYGFGLLMSGGGWLLGTIVVTVMGVVRNTGSIADGVLMGLMLLPVPLILLAILLPFHLKFGGEKGRIIMICVAGGLFVIGIIGAKIIKGMNVDIDAMWEKLSDMGTGAMGTGAMVACCVGIGILILALSCRVSISIMKKWEF